MMFLSDLLGTPFIIDIDPAKLNLDFSSIKPTKFNENRRVKYADTTFIVNNDSLIPDTPNYAYFGVNDIVPQYDNNGNFTYKIQAIDPVISGNIDEYGLEVKITNSNENHIFTLTPSDNGIFNVPMLSTGTRYTMVYRTYYKVNGKVYYGKWSEPITFTTPNVSISTPVITLKDSDGNILDPTMLLGNGIVVNVSGFNIVGSNEPLDHVEVTITGDGSSITRTFNTQGNLLTLDNLLENKTYTISAKFYTASFESQESSVTFTTKQYFLDTPIVEIPTNINENSTVTGRIRNYNSDYTYNITVNIGKVTNNGDGTFTYKSIDITDGVNHSDVLTVNVTDGVYHGEPVVKDLTIVYLPLVADDGIQVSDFNTDANENNGYTYI